MASFNERVAQSGNPYFPFDPRFDCKDQIFLEIPAGVIFDIYEPIFKDYGIYGNGPDWDGIITQTLGKIDNELLERINFNSEGDYCVMEFEDDISKHQVITIFKDKLNNEGNLRKLLDEIDTGLLDG